MLRAAIAFLLLALIAILVDASGIADISVEIGRTLLFAFVALAVTSFAVGPITGRTPKYIY
jgi:uncharacterized membrane protein YtjA (UPF0391 family)